MQAREIPTAGTARIDSEWSREDVSETNLAAQLMRIPVGDAELGVWSNISWSRESCGNGVGRRRLKMSKR